MISVFCILSCEMLQQREHYVEDNPGENSGLFKTMSYSLYKDIILLLEGFHQLRVRQKLLFKGHSCRGYKEWCSDAGVIASGSADQAFEGRHYYRCMRVHKECPCSVQD